MNVLENSDEFFASSERTNSERHAEPERSNNLLRREPKDKDAPSLPLAQKKQEETGLMATTESNKIRLTPSFHQMTRPLPDFFEASIKPESFIDIKSI